MGSKMLTKTCFLVMSGYDIGFDHVGWRHCFCGSSAALALVWAGTPSQRESDNVRTRLMHAPRAWCDAFVQCIHVRVELMWRLGWFYRCKWIERLLRSAGRRSSELRRQLAQFGYPVSKVGVENKDTFFWFSRTFPQRGWSSAPPLHFTSSLSVYRLIQAFCIISILPNSYW